ncbi:ChaC-like protein-domain-containing protein [Zopfochytrium polystomum]|nr:ChaC-like protein-domain-containing protein [Zopfochytrium polystomum]
MSPFSGAAPAAAAAAAIAGAADDFWIFGYGSLIWKIDFPFSRRVIGYVPGVVRRFWQGSHDHRGTPDTPGRVVTLLTAREWRDRWRAADETVRGDDDDETISSCWGVAYKVPPEHVPSVRDHLDFREKNGYQTLYVSVLRPGDGGGKDAAAGPPPVVVVPRALVYVATTDNHAFLGPAPLRDMARQISVTRGPSGRNLEYFLNLAAAVRVISSTPAAAAATGHMRSVKHPDAHLEALHAAIVEYQGKTAAAAETGGDGHEEEQEAWARRRAYMLSDLERLAAAGAVGCSVAADEGEGWEGVAVRLKKWEDAGRAVDKGEGPVEETAKRELSNNNSANPVMDHDANNRLANEKAVLKSSKSEPHCKGDRTLPYETHIAKKFICNKSTIERSESNKQDNIEQKDAVINQKDEAISAAFEKEKILMEQTSSQRADVNKSVAQFQEDAAKVQEMYSEALRLHAEMDITQGRKRVAALAEACQKGDEEHAVENLSDRKQRCNLAARVFAINSTQRPPPMRRETRKIRYRN